MHYLEDIKEGYECDLGSVELTEESILEFAEKYDPQRFHLDKAEAEKLFGKLFASGWHTASLCQRLMVDGFLNKIACMTSPGIDDLRFIRPAYADDVLTGKLTVLSSRVSKSKPEKGIVRLKLEMTNADNELVLTMITNAFVACRPK